MKRFLVTEEEKKEILNLYSKKGLMIEQNSINENQEPSESFRFAGWLVVISGDMIHFYDSDENLLGSYNGNLNNLKYDPVQQVFLNDDMLVSEKEDVYNSDSRIRMGEKPSKEKLLSSIRNYVRSDQSTPSKPNETKAMAFAVGITNNKTPMFTGIYPEISRQKEGVKIQGQSRKTVVTEPVINLTDMYVVSNKEQFNQIKWFIDKIDPNIKFKDFEKVYGISLNIGNPYSPGYGPAISKTTTETEEFIPMQIGDAISDPFGYDNANLSEEGLKLLKNFAKQFTDKKVNSPKLYQDYLNSLKGQTIKVYAYASIDRNPEEVMTGGYTSCNKPNQKRKEYNRCLSEARANNVIIELKKLLPDFFTENSGITFTPVGVGETDQFAKGKKWPGTTDTNQTLPNRRYTIVFPTFSKTYKAN